MWSDQFHREDSGNNKEVVINERRWGHSWIVTMAIQLFTTLHHSLMTEELSILMLVAAEVKETPPTNGPLSKTLMLSQEPNPILLKPKASTPTLTLHPLKPP